MRKATGIVILLFLGLTISGCGSSNASGLTPGNINGTWMATLTNPDGSIAYQFSATFTQSTGSELSITNLTYTASESCSALAVPKAAGGSFTVTGSSNGKVAGTFGMIEALNNVGGPELTLQGTLSNGTISGTWRVSGLVPPCSGNGLFTIAPTTAG
jgi:hypothetical protein